MHDQQLVDQSQAHDPAGPWKPRQASNSLTIATGAEHTGNFTRSKVVDGQVVGTQNGEATFGSTDGQQAANTAPFDYAVDQRTRCRIDVNQLQEDSILYFGESCMTVAQARTAGFLPPGWQRPGAHPQEVFAQREASAESALRNQASTEERKADIATELQAEGFANRAVDVELTALVNSTGGLEQLSAIKEIIETGQIDENTLGTLATQLAIEPSALNEKFSPIIAEFEKQGRAAFSAGGLDADEVIAWSQENRPDALKLAMRKQATQRSTAGYVSLRNDFLANLGESNPERALSADLGHGITSYRDPKGRVMVRLSGGEEMLWKTAIQAFGPK